ncbi:MAG: hypothetical protein PHR83_14020 [Paludibacter sp.]|nr:hypothetical protein [Paludibacter sp.]
MEEKKIKTVQKSEEISLAEMLETVKTYWTYLSSKWLIICIFGFGGAALGLVTSFLTKPTYTARLSFALIEKSNGGGLADLASSFGFGGLSGGGNAFSGDNLLEIIQSRYAIEKVLLTPVNYNGRTMNLVEAYIDFSKLRKSWAENPKLCNLKYPIGQKRETFTRVQDSILGTFFNEISSPKALSIVRKDKKISIVNIDFKSGDEVFSKLFVEKLMEQTYNFYKETKTAQSRANINMMQHTADSIKALYEGALYKGAGYSQVNINQALQFAAVPRIKQENNAHLYGSVYAEVLKNLETLKLDMARETPIAQIIDSPRLPLKKERLGKTKGIILGGLLGGFLIFLFFMIKRFFEDLKNQLVK